MTDEKQWTWNFKSPITSIFRLTDTRVFVLCENGTMWIGYVNMDDKTEESYIIFEQLNFV